MQFFQVLMQMLVFFLLIVTGYISRRLGLMDDAFNKKLSALIVNVTMPALILSSVANSNTLPEASEILSIILTAFICYGLLLIAALIFPFLSRCPPDKKGVYRFMLAFGNVGFIGFPVATSIFGPEALFYATIFNFPFNFLVYTVGVSFIAPKLEGKKSGPRLFLTPCVIASLLTIILALLKVPIPSILGETFSLAGQVTTPVVLLIIGSTLAGMPAKHLLGSPRLFIVAAIRLLVIPGIVWFSFRGWISDPLLLGVAVILSGMPVATNGTLLCYEHGGDQTTMSQGIFITTMLSIITIPLLSQLPFGL